MIGWIWSGPTIVNATNSYRATNSSPRSFFTNITNGTGRNPPGGSTPESPADTSGPGIEYGTPGVNVRAVFSITIPLFPTLLPQSATLVRPSFVALWGSKVGKSEIGRAHV